MPAGRLAEACRKNNVLLAVTADHGMVFPGEKGKGGHSADKYAARLEALRVPWSSWGGRRGADLAGRWMEMDIAPTVLNILNISGNLSGKAGACVRPRAARYASAARPQAWRCGGRGAAGRLQRRRVLLLGPAPRQYSLKAEEREWQVTVNGTRRWIWPEGGASGQRH